MRRGAMQSFTDGYQMGRQMYQDYENAQLKQGLADAAQSNTVTEGISGDEATSKANEVQALSDQAFNEARDAELERSRDPQAAEKAGLDAAAAYKPAIEELQRKAVLEKPEAYAGKAGDPNKKQYANRAEAEAAASGANQRGMADAYRKAGRPEQAELLNQRAMQTEAAGLQLKQAKREDQVADKEQGLKLGSVDQQYKLLEQDYQNKLASGSITQVQLQRAATGEFVNAARHNPALADYMVKQPAFEAALGAKDIEFKPGSRDTVIFTKADGSKHEATLASLEKFSKGGSEGLKYTTLAEGGMLVGHDDKGNVKEVARNPKAFDPSKNDAQMDDASKVIDRVLDANKTMMTQFGGRETEIRQNAVLLHTRSIGEFKAKFGRAPNMEEAAKIAEQAMKVATARAK